LIARKIPSGVKKPNSIDNPVSSEGKRDVRILKECFCHASKNSNQPQPLETGVAFLADDDVVVHGNAERLGDLDDGLGHLDVGTRGRRVA
jgi:hypothetical protein